MIHACGKNKVVCFICDIIHCQQLARYSNMLSCEHNLPLGFYIAVEFQTIPLRSLPVGLIMRWIAGVRFAAIWCCLLLSFYSAVAGEEDDELTESGATTDQVRIKVQQFNKLLNTLLKGADRLSFSQGHLCCVTIEILERIQFVFISLYYLLFSCQLRASYRR